MQTAVTSTMIAAIPMHFLHQSIQTGHDSIMGQQDDSMEWCRDFNCHHAMWDKERNHHLFTATATSVANDLISLLADSDMVMTLPRGMPMLQAMNTKNWMCVDNTFATENIAEAVICCNTAPRLTLRGPNMDHIPIHIIIDTGISSTAATPF